MKSEIKVAYFPPNASKTEVIKYNGKALDDFCIKCTIDEDFSNYTLDAMFVIKDNILDMLTEEAILKVQLDYGKEIFRISKVKVDTKYIEIVGRQITIADTRTLYLDDVEIIDENGVSALNTIVECSTGRGKDDIIISSDIEDINSTSYKMNTVYDVIQGSDGNSFINKWGGEIQRRGYNLKIDNHIGSERGFTIREGKNLTGFTGDSSVDGLVTRAKGQGANGIEGNWIDSPLRNAYSRDYISVIKYDDVKVKDENDEEGYNNVNEAKAELDRRIALEYSDSDIDKVKATYTINFVDLSKTVEYKNYIQAEKVYLGDTIRVYIPRVNQDIFVRAISKSYDVLAQKTVEITLSNTITVKPLSSQQIINDLKEEYSKKGNNIASYIDSVIKAGISDSYVIYRQNEILVLDDKDINNAVHVVRINRNGLAFSSTGYYGNYTYGFTIDGVINANLIRTGVLSAIKIQNKDSSFVMDLGGTSGMEFFVNNEKSMVIDANEVTFYDNEGTKIIGGLLSLQRVEDNSKKSMVLAHRNNSYLCLDYYNPDSGGYCNYIKFDKYNQGEEYGYPISFHENTDWFAYVCHYKALEMRDEIKFSNYVGDANIGKIFNTTENDLFMSCDSNNNLKFGYKKNDSYYSAISIHRNDSAIGGSNTDMWGTVTIKKSMGIDGNVKYYNNGYEGGRTFVSSGNNMIVTSNYNNYLKLCYEKNGSYCSSISIHRDDNANGGSFIDFYGVTTIYSDLTVKGSKNRAVDTEHYGTRLLNAIESADCLFADMGETTIGKDSKVKVEIDNIFLETVNTSIPYQVFLSKYGKGDCWVSERAEDYFVIEGTEGLNVAWEIKAKQKGYEDTRLEEFKIDSDNEGGNEDDK